MRKKEKKNNIMLVLGVILIGLVISVGYAALNANLSINGTARLGNATWNVKFENIRTYGTGNVTPTTAPYLVEPTEISYTVDISTPGDKYEFLVDVKNAGSIDAALDSHTMSTTGRADVIYTVKEIVDNTPTDINWSSFALNAGAKRTLLVSVVFDKQAANANTISTPATLNLNLVLNFVQA